MPDCTDVRTPCPVKKAPSVTPMILPLITTNVSTAIANQCWAITAGSINMPTETKNTAANMSRTGCTKCSMAFASPDSAISEPAMNAPNATEYPNDEPAEKPRNKSRR